MSGPTIIVGGGIAGLTLAHSLRQKDPTAKITLLEAGTSAGGRIRSDRENGWLVEHGPNGFLDNEPATFELIDELGLGDQVLRSEDAARRRLIFHDGALHALESNPRLFLNSPLLSRWGRARLLMEMVIPARRKDADESVGAFARRRLGKQVAERLVDPMISGIFAGDPDQLSLRASFPILEELEREHGGLLKALRARRKPVSRKDAKEAKKARAAAPKSAGPGGVLHSFHGGMQTLIDTLVTSVGLDLHCDHPVDSLRKVADGWEVSVGGRQPKALRAARVILALPAPTAIRLLGEEFPRGHEAFGAVQFAGVHVVLQGYERSSVAHKLDAFGFLIPAREKRPILGTLFSSSIFPERAPAGMVLLRSMVGGARNPQANEKSDEELFGIVEAELGLILGLSGRPTFQRIRRWERGIPQYALGHRERVAAAEREAAPKNLYFAGNSVAGVGVNHVIRHARELAETLSGGEGETA